MEFVLNIGIVLSIFLGILLFSKKDKVLTDNLMAIWLFFIGIHLTGYFLFHKGYWETNPHLTGITAPLPFLYGPFLYLYVLYSIKNESHLRKIDYLHFLPALLSYLLMSHFFFFYSAEEKVQVYKGIIDDYNGTLASIMLVGFIISGITYTILAYRKLVIREKVVKANFSEIDQINLKWLQNAIIGMGSFFVVATIVSILREIVGFQFPFNADILFYSIIVAFVVYIGYSGIKQKGLFANQTIQEEELVKTESEYKNSSLKDDDATKIHSELLDLMKEDKPYLNPKLTISELAQDLSTSTNHLSQVINQYEKVNFYDFVNKYRVEEFIENAQNNPEFSLLANAYDSGFNSKSTFNTAFKKIKSVTPSQYLSGLKS